MPHISGLLVYPVKACKGIPVRRAKLQPTGFEFDRQWMVVQEDNGKFVSQRSHPILCTVSVSLPALAGFENDDTYVVPPDATLTLSAPGREDLHVPLAIPTAQPPILKTVTVWEWTGPAADEGDAAAQWFSAVVGLPVRLVRFLSKELQASQVALRPTSVEFAVGCEVRFADAYPLLLASEASLADLNARLAEPVPMNRFRPNIVVADSPAWWEDTFRTVRVTSKSGAGGDVVELTSVKPCDRCKVPTVNQQTGEVGDEPSVTLSEFRSGKVLGLAAQKKMWTHSVFFGTSLVVRGSGSLAVGDTLEATGPQLNPLVPYVA